MTTITVKTKRIDDLHFEHQLWKSEAKFCADELKIYKNWLSDIASKNSKNAIRKQIEQFQNKFIIQKEQLDGLNHEINVHDQWLAQFAHENPVAIEHRFFADHKVMREQMEAFRKIFSELKEDFRKFLATWM